MACADCFKGFSRTDKSPTGTTSTIYGLPTYIAQPPSSAPTKGIIVIIPDAFGWEFINNRLLADTYAASGFRVYLPDFMAGVPAPLYFLDSMERLTSPKSWWDTMCKPYDLFWIVVGMVPFVWRNWPSTSHPRVKTFFEKIRTAPIEEDRGLKIGAAGFCWGGQQAVRLTHADEAHLVDSVFTAHPSMKSPGSDFEKVRKSVSVAVGDRDNMLSVKQAEETREPLKKLEGEVEGMKSDVVIYPGAHHGFSVRIDAKNPRQVEQSQQAERQAIEWFEETLR